VGWSGGLERGENDGGEQAPELDGGGHPAGFVVVHEGSLDGHELFGVDVFGRDAAALEGGDGGGEHGGWAADEGVGGRYERRLTNGPIRGQP
jgi:hypothetical protein